MAEIRARHRVNVNRLIGWLALIELLLGVAICLSLALTDCNGATNEPTLVTLEDSVHFYEDGL